MWLHRNEAHNSQPETQNTIQQLSQINQEIRRQWAIGTWGLPRADTKHFHHIKLAQLLKKDSTLQANMAISSNFSKTIPPLRGQPFPTHSPQARQTLQVMTASTTIYLYTQHHSIQVPSNLTSTHDPNRIGVTGGSKERRKKAYKAYSKF